MQPCLHHAPVVVVFDGDTCSICDRLAALDRLIAVLIAEAQQLRAKIGVVRDLAADIPF